MSLTVNPNLGDYVDRIAEILENSVLLFPRTKGNDLFKEDLVKKIFKFKIPIEQQAPIFDHDFIFITTSRTPIQQRRQLGRDADNIQGAYALQLELYCIIVVRRPTPQLSESKCLEIIQAVTTTLDKNKKLLDKNNQNPLAATTEWIVVPYLLPSTQKAELAYNVIVRPYVRINLRS